MFFALLMFIVARESWPGLLLQILIILLFDCVMSKKRSSSESRDDDQTTEGSDCEFVHRIILARFSIQWRPSPLCPEKLFGLRQKSSQFYLFPTKYYRVF